MSTPLHEAASRDDAGEVAILLRQGADPHAANAQGNTPFNFAAANSPKAGRLMTLHWFEQAKAGKGPGFDELSGSHRSPLIQYAAKWCRADELKTMLPYVNPFVQNASGWTPLHAAAAMPQRDAVTRVLSDAYGERPEFLRMRTTEAYTAFYIHDLGTSRVAYPAGLTAREVALTRLEQDKLLGKSDRLSLERSVKHLAKAEAERPR